MCRVKYLPDTFLLLLHINYVRVQRSCGRRYLFATSCAVLETIKMLLHAWIYEDIALFQAVRSVLKMLGNHPIIVRVSFN
jgi:hypothetical protein